jgi:hypothetical protein
VAGWGQCAGAACQLAYFAEFGAGGLLVGGLVDIGPGTKGRAVVNAGVGLDSTCGQRKGDDKDKDRQANTTTTTTTGGRRQGLRVWH